MSTAQRRGGKQSKLSAWQSLQSTPVQEQTVSVQVEEPVEVESEVQEETEPKVELKPIVKKDKTKTDGVKG